MARKKVKSTGQKQVKQRRRPVQARSLAKYNRILGAVPQVLTEKGYKGTTTEYLALEADVSIGTLYEYFSDKDDVFSHFLKERVDEVVNEVATGLSQRMAHAPDTILEWLIGTGVNVVLDTGPVFRLLVREMPGMLEQHVISALEKQIMKYGDLLYASQTVSISYEEYRVVLTMLTQLIVGYYMRLGLVGESGLDRETIKKELIRVVTAYFSARTGL